MFRRDLIKFVPRGKPLVSQSRDEDLIEQDPFAFFHNLRALMDILEDIVDGLEFRYGMVEFVNCGTGGVNMRINQPRQHHASIERDHFRLRPGKFHYLVIGTGCDNPVTTQSDRADDRKILVNSHHLPTV